ncbi:MAG: hypothetical protein JXA89_01585 [Anaerolineae bacterium]|nr:hypothetical protein [Anaerolineae bacterium]
MPVTVLVHVMGEDPFLAEVDELPQPTDQAVSFTNPRKRDGKSLHYVAPETVSVIFPWHRISFVEVMPSEETRGEIDLFFRE